MARTWSKFLEKVLWKSGEIKFYYSTKYAQITRCFVIFVHVFQLAIGHDVISGIFFENAFTEYRSTAL